MTFQTGFQRRRADTGCKVIGTVIAVAFVVVGAVRFAGTEVTPSLPLLVTPSDPPGSSGRVSMVVSPGSWVMDGGAAVTISAQLGLAPASCSYPETTIDWALDSSSIFLGTLSASTGGQVVFRPFDSAHGTVAVIASSSFILTCAGKASPSLSTGFATVHVNAALAVSGFSTYSDVIRPGVSAVFDWTITGGRAPYEIRLDFGDGFQTQFNLSGAGPATTSHRYSVGTYGPVLVVTDDTGRSVRTSLSPNLLVTASLGAAISASPAVTDSGVAVELSAEISGGIPPYITAWTVAGDLSPNVNVTYTPASGPNFTAKLQVSDLSGSQVEAQRTIRVNPAPSFEFGGPPARGDVGIPIPVAINVSGGTAPFELTWSLDPSKAAGNTSLPQSGLATALVLPSDPGPIWATFQLVDHVGATSVLSGWVANASATPRAFLSSDSALTEVGLPISATLSVFGGTSPFSGSIAESLPVGEPAGSSSKLVGSGPWNRTLTFESSGNATLWASVRDSVGALSVANASVLVLPPVSARVELASDSPTAASVAGFSVLISGGVPPYSAVYNGSDGEEGGWNISQPGATSFELTPAGSGFLNVMVAVTDGLGAVDRIATSLWVRSSTSPSSPASTPSTQPGGMSASTSWGGVAAGLGLIAAPLSWFLWRRSHRRRTSVASGAAGALSTIRSLVRENDGLDESSIVLLAEEQGIAPEPARRAVHRWRQAGRILEEEGPDGEPLLTWAPGTATDGQSTSESAEDAGLG